MKIKEMFEKHKIIIVCICIILALISLNIYTFTLTENEEPEIKAETPKEEKPKTIKVDLKGEVNAKGVYEMTEGSRITDQRTPKMIRDNIAKNLIIAEI